MYNINCGLEKIYILDELQVALYIQATVMVLEDSTERAAHRMCDFLKSLNDSVIITPEQMSQVRVLPEIKHGVIHFNIF